MTLTLTDPLGGDFFEKLALTCIPDPNRSTAIIFVDINGRSLYTVDCGRGKCPTPRKRDENCPGNMSGEYMLRGKCPDPTVLDQCQHTRR